MPVHAPVWRVLQRAATNGARPELAAAAARCPAPDPCLHGDVLHSSARRGRCRPEARWCPRRSASQHHVSMPVDARRRGEATRAHRSSWSRSQRRSGAASHSPAPSPLCNHLWRSVLQQSRERHPTTRGRLEHPNWALVAQQPLPTHIAAPGTCPPLPLPFGAAF